MLVRQAVDALPNINVRLPSDPRKGVTANEAAPYPGHGVRRGQKQTPDAEKAGNEPQPFRPAGFRIVENLFYPADSESIRREEGLPSPLTNCPQIPGLVSP